MTNTHGIYADDKVVIGRGKQNWTVIFAHETTVIVKREVPANTRTGWRTLKRYFHGTEAIATLKLARHTTESIERQDMSIRCIQCNHPIGQNDRKQWLDQAGTAWCLVPGESHKPMPQTWDTTELQRDFTVVGFAAPYVVVIRKADNVKGTLEFTHAPRVYFNFERA